MQYGICHHIDWNQNITPISWNITLQWRHNGRDGISNHHSHDYLLNRLFRCRSKKTSKLRVIGLSDGNPPVTGEFPKQRASDAENVSIWWNTIFIATLVMENGRCCAVPIPTGGILIRAIEINWWSFCYKIGFFHSVSPKKCRIWLLWVFKKWQTHANLVGTLPSWDVLSPLLTAAPLIPSYAARHTEIRVIIVRHKEMWFLSIAPINPCGISSCNLPFLVKVLLVKLICWMPQNTFDDRSKEYRKTYSGHHCFLT